MTDEQKAAYIISQCAGAMIRMEAMKAENAMRMHRGEALAYSEEAFDQLIDEYRIGHNDVVSLFNGQR